MTATGEIRHDEAAPRVKVRVLFFGAARDAAAGRSEMTLDVPAPATAKSALEEVLAIYPELRRFERALLVAVNYEYALTDVEINDGDEMAIFPPVSGGSSSSGGGQSRDGDDEGDDDGGGGAHDFFELTTEPINVGAVARRIVPRRCGATVTLDGYAREWTRGRRRRTLYLIYEAYEQMALGEMRRLGQEAHRRFDISSIGIVHRTGRTEIGETSVVISVSAPHRRAAFAACEWAISELKRTVPIWKKEFFEGGEMWVEGEGTAPAPGQSPP